MSDLYYLVINGVKIPFKLDESSTKTKQVYTPATEINQVIPPNATLGWITPKTS